MPAKTERCVKQVAKQQEKKQDKKSALSSAWAICQASVNKKGK